MDKENISFVKKFLFFCTLLILATLLINIFYEKEILVKKNFYRKELIYQSFIENLSEKKFDYVFFGDSHAFHAINPEFIKNAYNYGTGAENYIKTYFKLRKMIDKERIGVKNAVFEIDLHTFSSRLTDETNLFNELEVYSEFVSYNEVKNVTGDSILNILVESKLPFLGNGKEFGILIKDIQFNELNSYGWLKNKANFSEMNKSQLAEEVIKDSFQNQERINNISFEYFLKTIELADKSGTKIIFIKYPYTKEYKEAFLRKNLTIEEYYTFIFQEVDKTISNYTILDYSDIYTNNSEYFGDPAHLNYIGAEIFSKKVYSDLQNLPKASKNKQLECTNDRC